MIRSMTGYGSARAEVDGFALSAAIRSTNHRFLDLQIRLPANLEALEPGLRRQVRGQVARGRVEITVTVERAGTQAVQLNRSLLEGYLAACRSLRREFQLKAELDPVALLRIPGMVSSANGTFSSEELELLTRSIESLMAEGLARLNEMREREGSELERELRARLARLGELRDSIARLGDQVPDCYRRRIDLRVRELMEETGAGLDPGRLAQEVAYLASRVDIAEELTRLRSHLEQAQSVLDRRAEAGKKLDFLLQECNREANTLLSKTTDVPEVGEEIARQALEIKTEIEKLREQTQNIE